MNPPPQDMYSRPSSSEDVIRRVESLERYTATHGESISALTGELGNHKGRIERLEELAQMRAVAEAREDERDKALYKRLDGIDREIEVFKKDTNAQLSSIRGIGSRALWIFFSAIIVAVWQFIQKGGLG